jgi:hypothetical protein
MNGPFFFCPKRPNQFGAMAGVGQQSEAIARPERPLWVDSGPSFIVRKPAAVGGYLPLATGVSTVRYPIPQRTFKYVATVQSVTDETCQNLAFRSFFVSVSCVGMQNMPSERHRAAAVLSSRDAGASPIADHHPSAREGDTLEDETPHRPKSCDKTRFRFQYLTPPATRPFARPNHNGNSCWMPDHAKYGSEHRSLRRPLHHNRYSSSNDLAVSHILQMCRRALETARGHW